MHGLKMIIQFVGLVTGDVDELLLLTSDMVRYLTQLQMLKDMTQSRDMFPETEDLSKQSTSGAGAQQS